MLKVKEITPKDIALFKEVVERRLDNLPLIAGFVLSAEVLGLLALIEEKVGRLKWAANFYNQAGDIYHIEADRLAREEKDPAVIYRAFRSAALRHNRSWRTHDRRRIARNFGG